MQQQVKVAPGHKIVRPESLPRITAKPELAAQRTYNAGDRVIWNPVLQGRSLTVLGEVKKHVGATVTILVQMPGERGTKKLFDVPASNVVPFADFYKALQQADEELATQASEGIS